MQQPLCSGLGGEFGFVVESLGSLAVECQRFYGLAAHALGVDCRLGGFGRNVALLGDDHLGHDYGFRFG